MKRMAIHAFITIQASRLLGFCNGPVLGIISKGFVRLGISQSFSYIINGTFF
ncbi:hypothetical protein KC19_8G083100 [Ceratodon purpureus]|uniref:Uncharacterized protein n=1 Tax=Ceratodon purpureus TaxID=3225 RepID=A0A8T0H070_CERPU|nr:hypothetical protein KC19_8G083100 [Ceratodon purpureus]